MATAETATTATAATRMMLFFPDFITHLEARLEELSDAVLLRKLQRFVCTRIQFVPAHTVYYSGILPARGGAATECRQTPSADFTNEFREKNDVSVPILPRMTHSHNRVGSGSDSCQSQPPGRDS